MNKIVIILVLIVAVIGISGCIYIGEDAQVITLGDNSSNFTVLNKTVNNTYSTGGVSFKCPEGWNIVSDNIYNDTFIFGTPKKIYFPIMDFRPQFQIQILPTSEFIGNAPYNLNYSIPDNITEGSEILGHDESIPNYPLSIGNSDYTGVPMNYNPSEQEIIEIVRNETDFIDIGFFNLRISNNTRIIDGKTAYEDVFINNNLYPPVIFRKTTQIVFVKGNKTFLMIFEAQNWDYNKQNQTFNMIINSFKVQ